MKIRKTELYRYSILDNLMELQKKSVEVGNIDGAIRLSRYLFHLLKQIKDEIINIRSEDD